MSVKQFVSLLFKTAKIQQEIEREQKRRAPDWLRLLKLKKIRLVLKDKLVSMTRAGFPGRGQVSLSKRPTMPLLPSR